MQKSSDVLVPGYMFGSEAAAYLCTTERKISLYRRQKLLKAVKLGKAYVYRKDWLDEFMDTWVGYDLSSQEAIESSINEKKWRHTHV